MDSTQQPLIELLSSDEIDELLEPESALKGRTLRDSDDQAKQLSIVSSQFPRIANAVSLHWGRQDFYDYMDSILFTDRPDRAGFPPDVVTALGNLQRIHGMKVPRLKSSEA